MTESSRTSEAMKSGPHNSKVVLEVWEVGGCVQISISEVDENGNGGGYRIAGPSFAGNSRLLTSKTLNERDAKEIRSYIDKVGAE